MRNFVYIVGNRNSPGLGSVKTSLELIEIYEYGSDLQFGSLSVYEIFLPAVSASIKSHVADPRLPSATLDIVEIAELIGRGLAQKDRLFMEDDFVVTALVEVS